MDLGKLTVASGGVDLAAVELGGAPVLLHVPHSSENLPPSLLDGCDLARDIVAEASLMADAGADRVAASLSGEIASRLGARPYSVTALVSRVLVDMERFDGPEEEMLASGMGVVYEKAHDLSDIYRDGIPAGTVLARKSLYRVYSRLVSELSRAVADRFGRLVIIDVHSYAVSALPYELHGDARRPRLCVGTEDALALMEVLAGHGEAVAVNEPFSGSYCPIELWGDDRVSSVMLELRKDAYDHITGEIGADAWDAICSVLDVII